MDDNFLSLKISYFYINTRTASVAVDRGFEPRSGQTKDWNLYCFYFPQSTQHLGEKAKTCWLGNRIMCPTVATCLSADYCFSDLAL